MDSAFIKHLASSGDCVLWTGCLDRKGYGRLTRKGRTFAAHRYAWVIKNGDIPSGMFVLHKCDTPACVNVDHLFLGTQKDNMRDMDAKGRRQSNPRKGSQHGRAVVDEGTVLLIRAESGSISEIASKYRLNRATAWRIKTRYNWKHV